MDWGAWGATVHRVAKSWTWLKWRSAHARMGPSYSKCDHKPGKPVSSGNLLEMKKCSCFPDPWNQKLHFNGTPWEGVACLWTPEKVVNSWHLEDAQKMTRLPLYPPDPELDPDLRQEEKPKMERRDASVATSLNFERSSFEARESGWAPSILNHGGPHLFTWKMEIIIPTLLVVVNMKLLC